MKLRVTRGSHFVDRVRYGPGQEAGDTFECSDEAGRRSLAAFGDRLQEVRSRKRSASNPKKAKPKAKAAPVEPPSEPLPVES